MMNYFRAICLCLIGLQLTQAVYGQTAFDKWAANADSLNKKRAYAVAGGSAAIFCGALVGLNYAWYANYPRSNFHFFNDNGEWLEIDKCGHIYNAYSQACISAAGYRWAGVDKRHAALYGFATGEALQLTIEIMDGFSAAWGFSKGDFLSNTIGASFPLLQQYVWNDQRILLKASGLYRDYSYDPVLLQRANSLYGKSIPERYLKDYNAITTWGSVNIASFIKTENNFPKWLNVAVGYGADGMFGGYSNTWSYDANGNNPRDKGTAPVITYNRTDVKRYRQYYLSPDIDFTRIKTKSQFWKTCFVVLNAIKVPAPTLEYNSLGKLKGHWLYF